MVFIATTSGTTYSDTGLTAATTYEYTVSAFDAAVNISAHSATATATTLSESTPGSSAGPTSGGIELVLLSLTVEPDLYNAFLNFTTNLYTQAVVSWGETPDYEIGSIASNIAKVSHEVILENLIPGTLYYFKLELTDTFGQKLFLNNQQFFTKSLPDTTPPSNVTNLQAIGDDKVITLTWNNPKTDFDSVRIVRSEQFYPKDLWDGKVIYEGKAEEFVDEDVVYGKYYYYTLFVKDPVGNWSSGAVAKGRLYHIGEPREADDLYNDVSELPGTMVHPIIRALTLLDVDFFQDGEKIEVIGDKVAVRGDRELKISLDYAKVPEVLKTIAVTMRDPDDPTKTFSFLLRVNPEKTAYEANIAPLGRSGLFQFGISILDHKNQGLKKLAGVIVSVVPALLNSNSLSVIGFISENKYPVLFLVLLLLLALLALRLLKSIKKNSEQQN